MKPKPSFAPIYAMIYPDLATHFRAHGYALAVHGSLQSDLDLIAVPWVPQPSPPSKVIEELLIEFDLKQIGEPAPKLHHRTVYTLSLSGASYVDLSFMPVDETATIRESKCLTD